MKKIAFILFSFLLSCYSCMNESPSGTDLFICDSGGYVLGTDSVNGVLCYDGENRAARLLVQKVSERPGGIEEWARISINQGLIPLLDYTLFGYGTRYNLHYAVPLQRRTSGMIEGYLVYEVECVDSAALNLADKVLSPVVVDADVLSDIPEQERFIYSAFFLKWKRQGLNVAAELYLFAEKRDGKYLPAFPEKEALFVPLAFSEEVHRAQILYWIDLGGYLPDGADVYAYSLSYLNEFFRDRRRFLIGRIPYFGHIANFHVEINTIDIVVVTDGPCSDKNFFEALKYYMFCCSGDLHSHEGSPDLIYNIHILGSSTSGGSSGGSGGSGGSEAGSGGSGGGGSGSGPNPGAGEGAWNAKTHHGMLNELAKILPLSPEQHRILVEANDYCDSFLEGNQADAKAYLHAMSTSSSQTEKQARERFKQHLKVTLSDYFYYKEYDQGKAFFQLGVAIHGITDSFCPAHKGFQYFSFENLREHIRLDNGELSNNQRDNSLRFIVQMYRELEEPDVSIDQIIENWEKAYEINLQETE